ncbi:MAG TPA: DUF397 domain-containing protein [Actinomadura sp.]|jgi:hypothetical protein|nr:DUF397 domain-containing protein [Actinomadura sp.]
MSSPRPSDLAGLAWRTSRHSGSNANCVEVAPLPAGVAVRDSKDRNGPVLGVRDDDWTAFVGTVKRGDLDRP